MNQIIRKFYNFNWAIFLTILTLMGAASMVSAQSSPEVLTNVKILELVRMGLSEAVILKKISKSICQCDTSTSAIGKLKGAKVSDAIILAMMNTSEIESPIQIATKPQEKIETPPVPNRSRTPIESVVAGSKALAEIREPGIYWFEGEKMSQIEPSVFSGTKLNPLMSSLTFGVKKAKFRSKVRGASANMQVSNSQPVFYFVFNPELKNSGALMAGNLFWGLTATSPAEFMMVQLSVKQASREAVMGEFGAFTGVSMGARDKDIREYGFEKIRPGLYKVTSRAQLAPGEYCFYYAGNVTGLGFAGGKVFDFSVK